MWLIYATFVAIALQLLILALGGAAAYLLVPELFWSWLSTCLRLLAIGDILIKVTLTGWAVRALRRRRLLTPGQLAGLVGLWLAFFLLIGGWLAWVLPPDALALYDIALVLLTFLPMEGLPLAPLAVAWNRHR